jgi:hypothetical protein
MAKRLKRWLPMAAAATAIWLFLVGQVQGQTEAINLLVNGDFDESFHPVPPGWHLFWLTDDNGDDNDQEPQFGRETAVVYAGQASQRWRGQRGNILAGLYQQVDILPGSSVRLTAKTTADAPPATWVGQRIGIDPTGGIDPDSPTVRWSAQGQFVNEQWGGLAVEAKAAAETITIFLTARPNRDGAYAIYYDNARLTLVAFPAASLPPAPAATVDPLLAGLLSASGIAPGQQGMKRAAADTGEATDAANRPQPGAASAEPGSGQRWLPGLALLILLATAVSFILTRYRLPSTPALLARAVTLAPDSRRAGAAVAPSPSPYFNPARPQAGDGALLAAHGAVAAGQTHNTAVVTPPTPAAAPEKAAEELAAAKSVNEAAVELPAADLTDETTAALAAADLTDEAAAPDSPYLPITEELVSSALPAWMNDGRNGRCANRAADELLPAWMVSDV